MGIAANIGDLAGAASSSSPLCFGVTVNLVVIAFGLRAVFFGLLFQQFLAVT